jgi:branched-chain amino acid transport system substrate-binding protein
MKNLVLIAGGFICIALAGCDAGEDPVGCETIVVGAGLPLSGGSEGTGQNVLQAVGMAITDINDDGGIDGFDLELRVVDDGSGKEESVVDEAARTLASESCIVAVVGHLNSDATTWAQATYERAGIVNYTPASTASYVAADSPWTFRNLTHNGYKGAFLAEYANQELGIDRIGVVYDDDGFGMDLRSFFTDQALKIGLDVVDEFSYTRSNSPEDLAAQFQSYVADLLSAGAEAMYISGVLDEGVALVKEIRKQAGVDMPIIWSGWEEPLLVELAGPDAENVHVPIHRVYDPDNPAVATFQQNFQNRYGVPPGAFAPFAYDATMMIAQAVREVGVSRAAIRVALLSRDRPEDAYSGLTGDIYFDDDGDLAEHFISALVVEDGQFVPFDD